MGQACFHAPDLLCLRLHGLRRHGLQHLRHGRSRNGRARQFRGLPASGRGRGQSRRSPCCRFLTVLYAKGSALCHVQAVFGKDAAGAGDAQPAGELVLDGLRHAGHGFTGSSDAVSDALHQAGNKGCAHLQELGRQGLEPGNALAHGSLDAFPVLIDIFDRSRAGQDTGSHVQALLQEPGAHVPEPVPACGEGGPDTIPVLVDGYGGHADTCDQQTHGIEHECPPQDEGCPPGHGKAAGQCPGQIATGCQGRCAHTPQGRTDPAQTACKNGCGPWRHAQHTKEGLDSTHAGAGQGTEGQQAPACGQQGRRKEIEAQTQGQQAHTEAQEECGPLGQDDHKLLIFADPLGCGSEYGQQALPNGQGGRQESIAQALAHALGLDAHGLPLFQRALHALGKILSDDVLPGGLHGFGLDLLVVLHLHDHGPQEVHGLHVAEKIAQSIGFIDALEHLLLFAVVLFLHGCPELGSGCRALRLQVFHDQLDRSLERPQTVLCQLLYGAFEVYARIGKFLDGFWREDLGQIVAHIVGSFVIAACPAPRYLQGCRHLGHGFIAGDAHAGQSRGHLRQVLGHVLQLYQTGLAGCGQDVEGRADLFGSDAQVVAQGQGGGTQVVHAGPRGCGHTRQFLTKAHQLFTALYATGHQNLHAVQHVGLHLIGLARNGTHCLGKSCLVPGVQAAGDGDIPDAVLLFGSGAHGHARRGQQGRTLQGESGHVGINA